jgi:hypothetical protein
MLALVAMVLIAVDLLLLPASPATASPTQDCSTTTLLEPCTTTSLDLETTTTFDDTSTTVEETPTTEDQAQTATTRSSSATTEEVLQTTTTLSVSTSINVLVPGDGTEGAESTTTTVTIPTTVEDSGPSDGTLISLVIIGLVLIAGVVSVLTWRYWVATRPPLRDADSEPSPAG